MFLLLHSLLFFHALHHLLYHLFFLFFCLFSYVLSPVYSHRAVKMALCTVLAGWRSVLSVLLLLFLFICFISPNHSLWTYDCKTLLHICAVIAGLTRSGKCYFLPRFMPSMPVELWTGLDCGYRRTPLKLTLTLSPVEFGRFIHKRHSFLHPISLASWIPFSLVVVQHQQQVSREVNLNNLRFCMAASVLDGVLLFSLESGTIKMPLANKDHSQIKQLF